MKFWGIIVGLPALAPAVQRQGVVTSPSNPGDGVPQSIAVGSTAHYVTREYRLKYRHRPAVLSVLINQQQYKILQDMREPIQVKDRSHDSIVLI